MALNLKKVAVMERRRNFWNAHSKGVKKFGQSPSKTVRQLFRESVSGKKLSKKQRRELLETLTKLRKNKSIVEKLAVDLPADKALSVLMQSFGMKPEPTEALLTDSKIQQLLKQTEGQTGIVMVTEKMMGTTPEIRKDSFGFILRVDNGTFHKLQKRTIELGLNRASTRGKVGATTTSLVVQHPSKGTLRIPLTIMPKEPLFPEKRGEMARHERAHREESVIGMMKKRIGMPRTRQEARERIESKLRMEFSASIKSSSIDNLNEFMSSYFVPKNREISDSMTEREIREIIEIPKLIEAAIQKMPREEVLGLVRTTPLKRLKKTLERALQ